MTDQQRTKLLLGVLGLLVAIVVLPRLFESVAPAPTPGAATSTSTSTSPRRGQAARTDRPLVDEVVDLDLDALTPSSGRVSIGRDPWRFRPKPAPPPPPRVEPPRPIEVPKPIEAPPPPTGPQPPSTDHLAYLGSFGPRDRQLAVIRGRDDLWVVRVGEIVEDSFSIENIGLESVDIGFVGFADVKPRRIGLGG